MIKSKMKVENERGKQTERRLKQKTRDEGEGEEEHLKFQVWDELMKRAKESQTLIISFESTTQQH